MLIGLTGRPGAGQDDAADYLSKVHGFAVVRLDAPLRRMLQAGLGITPEQLSPGQQHEKPPGFSHSPFELLHSLRWTWVLTAVHDDTLAAMARDAINEAGPHPVVIPDIFTPAEAALVHELDGRIVRLVNRAAPCRGPEPVVPERDFDQTIEVPPQPFGLFDQLDALAAEEAWIGALS